MASYHPTLPVRPCDVTLRDVQPADVPTLFAFENDPVWCEMARVKPRSAAVFGAVWARIFEEWAAGESLDVQKAIVVDGELCGTIGCRMLDGRWTVGYGLGRAYWGRGIASRVLALLLVEVKWRPLYATTAATNIASIRVLMKHGFVIEETRATPETERCLARDEVRLVFA